MSNILYSIMFFCTLPLFITSCGSEEDIPDNIFSSSEYFKIVGDTVIMEGSATEATVTVTANCGWTATISGRNGWDDLHVTPDQGEGNATVTITTTANDTPGDRKGQLVISTNEGIARTLHILQQPGNVILEVASTDISFNLEGGRIEVPVNSNTEWTVRGSSDWCSTDVAGGTGNGSFTITAQANNDTEERKATFTIAAGTMKTVTINVKQSNKETILNVSHSTAAFRSMAATEGQTKEIKIMCNDQWTARLEGGDWLTIDKWMETANILTMSNVTIACEDNTSGKPREASIIVSSKGLADTITVTQSNVNTVFDVSPTNLSFRVSTGQMKEVKINSNASWRASASDDWIEISPLSGGSSTATETETALRVTCVEENTTGVQRMATITLRCGEMTQTVTVKQSGSSADSYLDVEPGILPQFSNAGESKTVSVKCNASWQVFGETEWCQLHTSNGGGSNATVEGDGSVTITALPNTLGIPRMATISFFARDTDPVYFIVTQGYYDILAVSPQELSFEAAGGSSEIYVDAAGRWTATASPWLSLNSNEGSGSARLTVVCAENADTVGRQGIISIESDGQTIMVSVTQKAREQPSEAPVLSPVTISDIIDQRATLSATYSSEADISELGFVYATHPAPTKDDTQVACEITGLVGTMSATLSGLVQRTTYYVRAYATNAAGTAYGEESSFDAEGRPPVSNDNDTPELTRKR